MELPAIPQDILTHEVTLYATTGLDADNNPTYATAVVISFVRCEPVSAWRQNSNGEMKDDKLTLFFDCVNSSPNTATFKKGDKVVFNSQDYFIRDMRDFRPHHLEIYLK